MSLPSTAVILIYRKPLASLCSLSVVNREAAVLVSSTSLLPSAARFPIAQGEVCVHASVTEIERADRQRLLPGEADNWDCYRVVEMAPRRTFGWARSLSGPW